MIELFWIGGPFFMLPLLLASIAVVTIAIVRFRSFQAATVNYDDFLEEMKTTVAEDGIAGGIELAEQVPGPVAATWTAGLQSARQPLQILRDRMDSVAIAEIQRLERYLPVVSVVAQVAPLIGILGTVWGMIDAFDGMAGGLATGVGVNGEIIADGIGRALTTTAAGLAVAISATFSITGSATKWICSPMTSNVPERIWSTFSISSLLARPQRRLHRSRPPKRPPDVDPQGAQTSTQGPHPNGEMFWLPCLMSSFCSSSFCW